MTAFTVDKLNTHTYIHHIVARVLQDKEFQAGITTTYNIVYSKPGVTVIHVNYMRAPAYSTIAIHVPDHSNTNFLDRELPNIIINTRTGFTGFASRPNPRQVPYEHMQYASSQFYLAQYSYRVDQKEPPRMSTNPFLFSPPSTSSVASSPPTQGFSTSALTTQIPAVVPVIPVTSTAIFPHSRPQTTSTPSATYTPLAAMTMPQPSSSHDERFSTNMPPVTRYG